MGGAARVGSIHPLRALSAALAVFGESAKAALDAACRSAEGATRELEVKHRRWKERARQLEAARDEAVRAFDACHSRTIVGKDGQSYTPPCTAEMERARQLTTAWKKAEDNVAVIGLRLRTIEVAFQQFKTEGRQLRQLCVSDLVQARTWLDGRIGALEDFGREQVVGDHTPIALPSEDGCTGPTAVVREHGAAPGEKVPRMPEREQHLGSPERR